MAFAEREKYEIPELRLSIYGNRDIVTASENELDKELDLDTLDTVNGPVGVIGE